MTFAETGGTLPVSQEAGTDQSVVADLASKVAELPHRTATMRAEQDSTGHGWFWWSWYLLAWAGTLTLAALAVLRIVYHDGTYLLTWFNAFTCYVYLPAYLGLAWAIWQRRAILALVSAAIVFCHLAWMAPDFVRDRRHDLPSEPESPRAADSPSLRIFFANVRQHNRKYEEMFDEIAVAEPDVVVFAEWGWAWNKAFRQSSIGAAYPFGGSVRQPYFGMVNVFSKLPVKNEILKVIDGRLVRSLDIELGAQTLRLVGVHAARPLYPDQRDYLSYWNQLIPLLSSEPRPLVVIGDFNATEHSLVYQRLKALGLRSAHDDRGRGYATTWPNDPLGISLIRIDQAFLSSEVDCQGILEGRGNGSDHKPIVLDLRLREGVHTPHPAADRAP
jgi:endonuclease/exonuclease/phosphatase (EEP) superfamily protein YafD